MIEAFIVVVVLFVCGLAALIVAGAASLFRGMAGGSRVARLEVEVAGVQASCGALTAEMGQARAAFERISARVTTIERYLEATSRRAASPAGEALSAPPAAFAPPNVHAAAAAPPAAQERSPQLARPLVEISPLAPAPAAAPSPVAANSASPTPAGILSQAAANNPSPTPAGILSQAAANNPSPTPADIPSEAAANSPSPALDDAPASPAIDWERWIGVRGAAALGAAILVIAGLYFFKFAADRGVFTLPVRTVIGGVVGAAAVAVSQLVLRERHRVLSGWLAGAGIAILYITTWAAGPVYHLVGTAPAVAGMVAVTAGCVALSLRHASLPIAILGLFGGFLTPLALSSTMEHPLQLFGYLFVLDLGLLAVARRRGWQALTLLSFGLTLVYEGLWVVRGMEGAIWPGFGLVALFAALFGLASKVGDGRPSAAFAAPDQLSAAALLVPFAFALYLGLRAEPGIDLLPLAVMVAVPAAGAVVRAAAGGGRGLAVAASLASLAVLGGWLLRNAHTASCAGVVAVTLVLAAVFHATLEVQRLRAGALSERAGALSERAGALSEGAGALSDEIAGAALIAALGGVFLVLAAGLLTGAVGPVVGGVAVLCAALFRQAAFPGREALHLAPGLAVGIVLPALHAAHLGHADAAGPAVHLAGAVIAALALLGGSLLRRAEAGRRWAAHGAALGALLLLAEPVLAAFSGAAALPVLGAALALGAVLLAVGILTVHRAWIVTAMVAVAAVHSLWSFAFVTAAGAPGDGLSALLGVGAATALFALWPVVARGRFGADPAPYRTAAFAGPLFFPALGHAWSVALGGVPVGLLALVLAAVTLAPALVSVRGWDAPADVRRAAVVPPAGVAVALVSIAIPMTFEEGGITVGCAVLGLALVALFRRFDHLGLKYAGLAHLAVAAARVIANEGVLDAPAGEMVLLNGRLLTHGVSALCLVGAYLLLRDIEVPRLRGWEEGISGRRFRLATTGTLLSAVAVVFVWLNVEVWRAFTDGQATSLVEHAPARDLTLSAAWVAYALGLLGLGMRLGSRALRRISLVLLLATSGKVFLYDLGQLRDLYRVASLAGLAVSLILVSIVYQRFVLGGGKRRPA